MKKELKKYYLAIRRLLPCGWTRKKAFIRRLDSSIAAYVSECHDADFTQIERHFGTPQQIATAYFEEMDTREIASKLKIRRSIVHIVATVIAIIALVLTVVVIRTANTVNNSVSGYFSGYVAEHN